MIAINYIFNNRIKSNDASIIKVSINARSPTSPEVNSFS